MTTETDLAELRAGFEALLGALDLRERDFGITDCVRAAMADVKTVAAQGDTLTLTGDEAAAYQAWRDCVISNRGYMLITLDVLQRVIRRKQ